MNPFEIFGLMAAATFIIQGLLAALLQLAARVIGERRRATDATDASRTDRVS